MKRLFLLLSIVFAGIVAMAQNTSPLVVKDFIMKPGDIIDLDQIPKDARTDWDSNPICRIKVKAVGFDENLMQKFVFVPNGLFIMHKTIKDGQVYLYVSSNKTGEIKIVYMGDCVFKLPYKLEASKTYELTLGLETATLIIRSVPTDAEIYIDNEKAGVGEAIKAVSIGTEHRYRVVSDDYYTKEGQVFFSKREEKAIRVELEPNYGYITIKTEPTGADVYVDDVKVGKTPYMMKKIKLGSHVVELRKTGFETYADMVSITIGDINSQLDNVTLEAKEMVYGSMELFSIPDGAVITINGRQYGITPRLISDLEAGSYTVNFSKEGYETLTQSVEVLGDRKETLNVVLTKKKEQPVVLAKPEQNVVVNDVKADNTPTKMLNGKFSVSRDKKVYFSQGNLQYKPVGDIYHFAANQWDYIGSANRKATSKYDGWIDLFIWGYEISTITNGADENWYVMDRKEWQYLFDKRPTPSGIRYAKAQVNGVNGVIVLPDNWDANLYTLNNVNKPKVNFNVNIVSKSDWLEILEVNGAVFLPAAGWRYGSDVSGVGTEGYYWSTTKNGSHEMYLMYFRDKALDSDMSIDSRGSCRSSRLVRVAND